MQHNKSIPSSTLDPLKLHIRPTDSLTLVGKLDMLSLNPLQVGLGLPYWESTVSLDRQQNSNHIIRFTDSTGGPYQQQ